MNKENNQMCKRLLILGAGQYGRVLKEIADATGDYSHIAFLDDSPSQDVIGKLNDYRLFADKFDEAIVAIGNDEIRLSWIEKLKELFTIPVIVHPSAYISPSAIISEGSIIEPLAVVHTSVNVGRGCIISAGAIINHNSILSDGVHCDCGCVIPARSTIESKRKVVQGEIALR